MGCDPDPANVRINITAGDGAPTGGNPAASRSSAPGTFDFPIPLGTDPATLYGLTVEILDPSCAPQGPAKPIPWLPSDSANDLFVPMGNSTLELSTLASQLPAGDFGKWATYYEKQGILETWRQYVRTQSTTTFEAVRWQVSLQPFSANDDPLDPTPEGLLAFGDVPCANTCIFVIEFEKFMPKKSAPSAGASWVNESAGLLLELLNLLPASQAAGPPTAQSASAAGVAPTGDVSAAYQPAANLVFGPPLNVYFRTIPIAKGHLTGPVSNTAIFRWTGPYGGPDASTVKIPDCTKTPKPSGCAQPPKAAPPGYEVDIVAYHGWIPPQDGHYGCYIVTKTTTVKFGTSNLIYPEGSRLCPPEPDEPNFLEAVVNFVIDSVNWVSNTYDALKKEVVSFVAQFVPAELCPPSCIEMLLNAGLMALGIPPSLPNFDQVVNGGIDYLAEQAAEQVGIPKEIQDLAGPAKELAVAEFKKQVKAQFKKGIQAGLEEMQKNLSKQVSWIPDGVPIKPDPLGDYQPPAATIKFSRKFGAPACTPGNLSVGAHGYNTTPAGKLELGAEPWAYLYEGESVALPPLGDGESIAIPVVQMPRLSWGFPGAKYASYKDAANGWSRIYNGGTAEIRAIGNPCVGGDVITMASEGTYP